jgi:hypothetical protein
MTVLAGTGEWHEPELQTRCIAAHWPRRRGSYERTPIGLSRGLGLQGRRLLAPGNPGVPSTRASKTVGHPEPHVILIRSQSCQTSGTPATEVVQSPRVGLRSAPRRTGSKRVRWVRYRRNASNPASQSRPTPPATSRGSSFQQLNSSPLLVRWRERRPRQGR